MATLQDEMHFRENAHRHATALKTGDLVLVSLRKHESASLHPRGPLAPHFAGPYKVLKVVSDNAYKIELPPELIAAKVHDVFNISHLKIYTTSTRNWTSSRSSSPPLRT